MSEVPWEIYPTREEALRSLGARLAETDLTAERRIPSPPHLLAYDAGGVICVQYDKAAWDASVVEAQRELRSLAGKSGSSRVVLDFGGRSQWIDSGTISCIYALYQPVKEVRGRFALCALTSEQLQFFQWHDKERIRFPGLHQENSS